jgi:hypothetical protein
MIIEKVLGDAVGVQWQGVRDNTESNQPNALGVGVIVGTFMRGRFDKPFAVNSGNIRARLGYEPNNLSYMAVQDALDTGAPVIWVKRLENGVDEGVGPVHVPSFIRFSGMGNDVAAYGVTQIIVTANGEPFIIPCLPSQSWRDVLLAQIDLFYDNQTHLEISSGFDSSHEFQYLIVSNVTAGVSIDYFEIELTLEQGSPAALYEQDGHPTYALLGAAHATFDLSRTIGV